MSLTLTRPAKSDAKTKGGGQLSVGLPQVNLLPPEVRAARSLAVVKRWLGLGLAAVLALVAISYVGATFVRSSAESDLADAQSETQRLEQEQTKYAEVPKVLGDIKLVGDARLSGTSTEVMWRPYLDAVAAVLPANVSLESFNVTAATPLDGPVAPNDPLQGPSVGSIAFTGRSTTIPDTSAWIDALASVPGFSDPWVSSVAVTQEDDSIFYTVSSTVQLTDAAYAHRFAATEGTN